MLSTTAPLPPVLPTRRPELLIRPLGEDGRYVVKNPRTGEYFQLGAEEHFLLLQLDGQQTAEAVRAAFEKQFGAPLSAADLEGFLELALTQGLLKDERGARNAEHGTKGEFRVPRRQSLLSWRKSLFDPDRLFNRLEPRIQFFWTRGFLLISAGSILLAAGLVCANRHEGATSIAAALRWETAVWVWLTLFIVTMLHECAHGLTCKHYGGEVHEIGFLLLFFMPCFYCNVSDAWLFREKSKRLWVTFAGGYFELFVWALAVFAWRLTLPGTLPHALAFVVVSVCGVQTLFNFNPLLKLDGYYLLSDWLEIPNLHQRAVAYVKGHLRWLLWGASRPRGEPRGRLLLGFGVVSWLYALVFLALMLWGLFHSLGDRWGWVGMGAVALLGLLAGRRLFGGFTAGEVRTMILRRHKRTVAWLLVLGTVVAVMCFVQLEDRASGPFQVRPATRGELRAPVAGFIRTIYADEGERVSAGSVVACLDVPDLTSRLAQKQAEVRESEARLRLLEVGARPEEVAEQRRRVERGKAWRDLGAGDLDRARQALKEDLTRLNEQVAQYEAESNFAKGALARAHTLLAQGAISDEQLHEADKQLRVTQSLREQAQAQRRSRAAQGNVQAETELARRDKELAEARGTLALLEAGSRPEEIEAERARLARLREETHHLESVQGKLTLSSPTAGLITTPRLKEKIGQYLHEGDLLCVVEEPAALEAEIALPEEEAARARPGQQVELKLRSLPFDTLDARVDRMAPAAVGQTGSLSSSGPTANGSRADVPCTVTVCCRIEEPAGGCAALRSGMTGHARIYCGRRPVGAILLDRTLRYVRTEFWW